MKGDFYMIYRKCLNEQQVIKEDFTEIAAFVATIGAIIGLGGLYKLAQKNKLQEDLRKSKQAIYTYEKVIKEALAYAEKDPDIAKYKGFYAKKVSYDDLINKYNMKPNADVGNFKYKSLINNCEFYIITNGGNDFLKLWIFDTKKYYSAGFDNAKYKELDQKINDYLYSKIAIASGVWTGNLNRLIEAYKASSLKDPVADESKEDNAREAIARGNELTQ